MDSKLAIGVKNSIEAIMYGKQVGARHKDGSVLRKGTTFLGEKGTKYLIDAEGAVKKFISKERKDKDVFEVVTGVPIPDSNLGEHFITRTIYSNEKGNRYIDEMKYIGRYFDGKDGGNAGWWHSRGAVENNTTKLNG